MHSPSAPPLRRHRGTGLSEAGEAGDSSRDSHSTLYRYSFGAGGIPRDNPQASAGDGIRQDSPAGYSSGAAWGIPAGLLPRRLPPFPPSGRFSPLHLRLSPLLFPHPRSAPYETSGTAGMNTIPFPIFLWAPSWASCLSAPLARNTTPCCIRQKGSPPLTKRRFSGRPGHSHP